MRTYRIGWEYIGIRGNEIGSSLIDAESAADAEDQFCSVNRIFNPFRPEEFGYMVNWIEEVKE